MAYSNSVTTALDDKLRKCQLYFLFRAHIDGENAI